MNALLGFSPFLVFSLLDRTCGAGLALAAAAALSMGLLLRDRLRGERQVNLLEAGSAVMFFGLSVMAFAGPESAWSLWRVRLWVDAGLVLIVVAGLLLQRPFTLHHARRQASPDVVASAAFVRANMVISGAWGLAFAVVTLVDALMVFEPATSQALAIGLTVASLAAAAAFTRGYPQHLRRRAMARHAPAAPM